MFNDLFSFYRSKEWRSLLETLKVQRLDTDGQLICEYCGKPMVKAYDIIGHHKQELTEDNVNDYNVSLNPVNVALVHHRCHNLIHNKLGYKVREVFVVYGAPLAGKQSWVDNNKCEGDLVVNIDDIWQALSGCDRYVKPKRLNAVVFKVRDTLLDAVKYRLGKWNNAYIIGGYPLQSERERLCRDLGAREVFIQATKDECLARLQADEARCAIEEYKQFIEDWFDRYIPPDAC